MNDKLPTLEVIAPSIEEAIEKGLQDLGLSTEDVEVEVLDEGSRGLFGLGSRHARIRLTIKGQAGSTVEEAVTQQQAPAPVEAQPPAPVKSASRPAPVAEPVDEDAAEEDEILTTARETVKELLAKMKVRADVRVAYGPIDDAKGHAPVYVNVNGDDLSILIGRRAETLNALQYISSLIISKELGHSITLVLDVEGYRARRESQLRQLARRMADQAVKTGRRQVLEPMPANERRIIHMELRGSEQVKTESTGEEPRRKVTIVPL